MWPERHPPAAGLASSGNRQRFLISFVWDRVGQADCRLEIKDEHGVGREYSKAAARRNDEERGQAVSSQPTT
jgi:hypothetical protein